MVRVGINGFGRMGRLALRAAWDWPDFEIVHVNEPAGEADAAAHLLKYDSVHRAWNAEVDAEENALRVNGSRIGYSRHESFERVPWRAAEVDIVVECSGQYRQQSVLQRYLDHGVKKVVVSAPVKDGALNIVMGVNDHLYDPDRHTIVTAASCTTNCIAPVIDVVHREFGIRHGSITTIHDVTNTQRILDSYHKDWRRARSCGSSLIPTSTGSATAIAEIFPELKGRLNGIAVRVPLANASLTDCVFEVEKGVSVDAVNQALKYAAEGRLMGVLGYEERPLVSVDYLDDIRSSIIDSLSTMVVNDTQVKILAWYDNEMGYVHRMMELVKKLSTCL